MNENLHLSAAEWLENSREHLLKLAIDLETVTKEEKITLVRRQYEVIANLKKVFKRDAYFVGVPNRKRQIRGA